MGKIWDTEKIEKFIESFAGAYARYTDDLHSLEDGMSKYYFNNTYRGQAAEASKNFIGEGQSKLHMKQIDIQSIYFQQGRDIAKAYIEQLEGEQISAFKLSMKIDSVLRAFILNDGKE